MDGKLDAKRLEELAAWAEAALAPDTPDIASILELADIADLARCAREYAKLTGHLLDQPWHENCQFVPSGDGVNIVYVDGTEHPPHLRYSRGPKQGFFWDIYGEEFSQELAIIALSQAPYPRPVGPICFSIKLNPIEAVEAAEIDQQKRAAIKHPIAGDMWLTNRGMRLLTAITPHASSRDRDEIEYQGIDGRKCRCSGRTFQKVGCGVRVLRRPSMIHRLRMARKRLGIAREREAKALTKDRFATDAYITLDPEAPAADVLAEMKLMCKSKRNWIRESYALRAIERRKDKTA